MATSCLTNEYRVMLTDLVAKDTDKAIIMAILSTIEPCSDVPVRATKDAVEKTKRKVPEAWGISPILIDAQGKETEFSSPSALVKHLGLPMSGIQCDPEGVKCKALSVIEILRINGYEVSGNGEPKKASEGGTKILVTAPHAHEPGTAIPKRVVKKTVLGPRKPPPPSGGWPKSK